MFDTIDGLPVHVLVVHAVVVLLPLAALGTIAIAVRPAWRARFGPLVVILAVAGTIACPVATTSGEALEARVGSPGEHYVLGGQLVWYALAMTLLATALVVLDRRARAAAGSAGAVPADGGSADGGARRGGGTATLTAEATAVRPRSALVTVVAVLAVVAALAAGFQTFRVGHSGAQVTWSGVVDATNG